MFNLNFLFFNMNIDRIPPQNLEAEMAVLGSMLLEKDAIETGIEKLSADSFYSDIHKKLYSHIIKLHDESKPVDLLTLTERLKNQNELEAVGGASYIASVLNSIPTAANVEHYIEIVQEKSVLRRLIDTATNIVAQCHDNPEDVNQILDIAEKNIFDITQKRTEQGISSFRELIKDSIEVVEKLYQQKRLITGVSTGFTDFDKITSGLQPSDLIVFAARPSMGKTSFALNIAEHVAVEEKLPVAVFSLEMSKPQLTLRMLCAHSRVNIQRVRTGFLGGNDFSNLVAAAGKLASAPVFIDDTPGVSIMELRAKARRLKAKHDIRLIIVDYLQLMQAVGRRSENRQQEISEISRALKGLARELNVPIIVISQLNRAVEGRQDHRPQLSDLRESGAIEQDADVVVLLLRKEYYDSEDSPGTADVIIAKQRNGPTGDIRLSFNSEFTKFGNFIDQEVPIGVE
jgi:replicative DNA helicase